MQEERAIVQMFPRAHCSSVNVLNYLKFVIFVSVDCSDSHSEAPCPTNTVCPVSDCQSKVEDVEDLSSR